MSRDRDQRYPDAETMRRALVDASVTGAAAVSADPATSPTLDLDTPALPIASPSPRVGSAANAAPSAAASGQLLHPRRLSGRLVLGALGSLVILGGLVLLAQSELAGAPEETHPQLRAAAEPVAERLVAARDGERRVERDEAPWRAPDAAVSGARPDRDAAPAEQPDVDAAAPAAPVGSAASDGGQVTITLAGVPTGGRITVDGVEVPDSVIVVDPPRSSLRVVVRAAGYRPWVRTVPGRSSATVAVNSRPLGASPPGASPSDQVKATRPDLVTDFGAMP